MDNTYSRKRTKSKSLSSRIYFHELMSIPMTQMSVFFFHFSIDFCLFECFLSLSISLSVSVLLRKVMQILLNWKYLHQWNHKQKNTAKIVPCRLLWRNEYQRMEFAVRTHKWKQNNANEYHWNSVQRKDEKDELKIAYGHWYMGTFYDMETRNCFLHIIYATHTWTHAKCTGMRRSYTLTFARTHTHEKKRKKIRYSASSRQLTPHEFEHLRLIIQNTYIFEFWFWFFIPFAHLLINSFLLLLLLTQNCWL